MRCPVFLVAGDTHMYACTSLDGKRIGDHMLDVGWTSFKTNRSYATHEIEPSALTPGKSATNGVGTAICAA